MSVNQSGGGVPTNTQAIATVTAAAAVAASSQFQRLKVGLQHVTVMLLGIYMYGRAGKIVLFIMQAKLHGVNGEALQVFFIYYYMCHESPYQVLHVQVIRFVSGNVPICLRRN